MSPSPASGASRRLPLSNATLDQTSPAMEVPAYDRDRLTPGVVHFSVGAFSRAHLHGYFDELAARGATEWGIVGVALHSSAVRDALEPQDLLYTLVERGDDGDRSRVVGVMRELLYAPDDPEAVFEALADERIRLVTLTVTGDGYHVDLAENAFDASSADVLEDLAGEGPPSTFAAYVVEGLARRRARGIAPFTVLSCDNVPSNGAVTRAAVTGFAARRCEDLARWIDEAVAFPSSMVDRITPGSHDEVLELVEQELGVSDQAAVEAEPFRQWVIEDRFSNVRPPLDEVGAQFVTDVAPYELMKKRLLNGTHCALGYLGSLAGHATSDEAMRDPAIAEYVRHLLVDEIAPLLPQVPGIDLEEYCGTLMERLANPRIRDDVARLGRRGSTKLPSYVLPSLREAVDADRPHALLVLAVAAWLRYLRGTDLEGRPLQITDARLEELQPLVPDRDGDVHPILEQRSVFGDLADDDALVEQVAAALRLLDEEGVGAAVRAALDASAGSASDRAGLAL